MNTLTGLIRTLRNLNSVQLDRHGLKGHLTGGSTFATPVLSHMPLPHLKSLVEAIPQFSS